MNDLFLTDHNSTQFILIKFETFLEALFIN